MRYLSSSARETLDIARDFAGRLKPGDVVAFRGGLGMGKTLFTSGVVKALGNGSRVHSPTFSLVNDYGGDPGLLHFDMYRVTDPDALYSTGFYDYLDGKKILFIEWSENIDDELPDDSFIVDIAPGEGTEDRIITIARKNDADTWD